MGPRLIQWYFCQLVIKYAIRQGYPLFESRHATALARSPKLFLEDTAFSGSLSNVGVLFAHYINFCLFLSIGSFPHQRPSSENSTGELPSRSSFQRYCLQISSNTAPIYSEEFRFDTSIHNISRTAHYNRIIIRNKSIPKSEHIIFY